MNTERSFSGGAGAEREVFAFPASFSQQRLWFLHQLEPGGSAYNLLYAFKLDGRLDLVALERSLDEIARRHEILRTTFAADDGAPTQIIHPPRQQPLSCTDLSQLPAEATEAEAARLIADEARRPFDLAAGPLFRRTLVKIDREKHILLLAFHHIVSDGWSRGILLREISVLYDAFSAGQESPLRPLSIQYADFAVRQRQQLQGKVLQDQLSYWKRQLSGVAVLELPTDRLRPAVPTFHGASESFVLPKFLTDALKVLSRQERVTLFMTLLAAFQTLLHRYTGQDDIAIGSPIAGRQHIEFENLIGFFVNTLVLRTDLSGDPTFKQLLGRVREMTLDAYTHQDLPFEKLVEELNPDRNLSATPLFQVLFVLQNAPSSTLKLRDVRVHPMPTESGTAKFDLTLSVTASTDSLTGSLTYNTDLFDAPTVVRMVRHFQRLLEAIAANPEQRLSALPILSRAERQEILIEWNDTKRNYPKGKYIHELFEAQVERTPDAVAVIFDGQELTYRELSGRANQLARYLGKLGVGPEVLVGICMERSLAMVIGLLAVLKAGGAYLPLDPTYPEERLGFMLKDAEVRALLTQEQMSVRFRENQVRIVCLDRDWEEIAREERSPPVTELTGENAAYVIYTSGTTGAPKGTVIEHKSLVNYLCWFNESPLAEKFLPATARATFDASLKQLFAPLLRGGSVWLVSDEVVGQPARLLELISARAGAGLNCAPSLWKAVLDSIDGNAPSKTVSSLLLGGETLNRPLVDRTFDAFPGIELWNLYGPTEATANAAVARIFPDGAITLGRPIANTRIYILDSHLEPVPAGVPGELCIAGAGVARGYLNRPLLTADKFVRDPFSDEPGARLYKTGDLARYLPDGDIEFLGRIDHQVKIHGFRIELGEIEAVLSLHPAVCESVVVARDNQREEKSLAAYVVLEREFACTLGELRSFLTSRLPQHMIPSSFVILESLPLTPNGKIDRRALVGRSAERPEPTGGFVVPRSGVEEVLTRIWAEVLKIDRIGIHDNFFELGGHSLLATQVVARARSAFAAEVSLRSFFDAPTVAGLAERIETLLGREDRRPVVAPEKRVNLPLSFSQERLWFLDRLNPDSPIYNIPSAFVLTGRLDVAALEKCLNEIVRRHEILRTTFRAVEGQPEQLVSPELTLTLPVIDLRDLPNDRRQAERDRLVSEEAHRPFDLSRGPLLRAKLLRTGGEEHVLLLTMHHIVSDGWSMAILLREISALYDAFVTGKQSPLAPLPIQYADFSVRQRQWLSDEAIEAQLSYWTAQLRGMPAVLELPTDRPRPAVQTFHGAHETFVLSRSLTHALKALSRQENVTLFMMLLAAFQSLLHRYTARDDIVVGSPIAGRQRVDLEDLIGFFVNTLVLRTDLSGNPTFKQLLGRVREVALSAYAHQDLPFEKLVEELKPDRSLSSTPLVQVMFVLQNAPRSGLNLRDVEARSLETGTGTAKFGLTLSISESSGSLTGSLTYNTDLFGAATVARMAEHFQTLLESIAANPERRLSDLSMLTGAERQEILVEWNHTKRDYPRDRCVHELFERQVERTPDAVAAVFEEGELTYRELNRRANQLAHHLRKLGVGPEARVAIYMDRSLEMIVGLLGILKAGGVYVPLDLDCPKERVGFMLNDSEARLLLTQKKFLSRMPEWRFGEIVHVDQDWRPFAHEPAHNPVSGATAKNLAYIIYTSGSTGNPKGVAVPHRAVNRLVVNTDYLTLGPGDVVAQAANCSFDAATFEIWGTLLNGARLVGIKADAVLSPREFAGLIETKKITTLFLTTALFNQMARELPSAFRGVRHLLFGGEAVDPRWVAEVLQHGPPQRLLHVYGPTETTTFASWRLVEPAGESATTIPIGRPIANTRIYLLDRYLQPVPVGVAGEIHIGGDGLARGYYNRPELTAEKFIPDPFDADPEARLYKTGDLARYLPDGDIEFLGRIDRQVKIRGFRVEPGEIEAALERHPAIENVVVMVCDESEGDPSTGPSTELRTGKRLAAYFTCDARNEPRASELRRYLKATLPEYMIPSLFVSLDAFPLTSNGKIDRRALPDPGELGAPASAGYVAPRTAMEKLIAEAWREVIGVERVGVYDNFFDLGGHSLLSMRAISRIEKLTGRRIPPAEMIYHTVEQLAAGLERRDAANGRPAPKRRARRWLAAIRRGLFRA
jgi:amino acid adenylation domain-containing protein